MHMKDRIDKEQKNERTEVVNRKMNAFGVEVADEIIGTKCRNS